MAVKKDFTPRRTVPKLGVVGKATGVLVVLASVFVGWLAVGGIVDGTLPFLHIVEPHGFSEKDMEKIDLSGKSVLVTGASSGLGLGVARSLARHGADLVVTARDSIKCEATLAALRKHAGQAAKVRCVEMELMSLVSTRAAAQQLAETVLPKLDYLVLNAGIMAPPTQLLSVDGNEAQFQVNHLSQFLLLKALIPSLLKSESTPTVVTVSSAAHWGAHSAGAEPLTPDALNNKALYNPSTFYGWSKLANILTARHLTRLVSSE
jgi:NAD(P)-dependent dehydrogenase (short-subunit alcohol dehydrogenase family)